MATLLTVSTHPPYVSTAGRSDEADRFREADGHIARFVAQLEQRGFLEKGVMMIVGDHRAMTPVLSREQQRLGADAEVAVPAILLGNTGLPRGPIAGNMQQTDLIPSLRHAISDHSCRSELQGRFLGAGERAARYVVHADPMRRNQVIVIEGDIEYALVLDGDYTHWAEAPPRAQDADRIREYVNSERMRRMVEFRASP
jgi:membrane-anchored protein YejM (alkaline phosphatase superfamily)